MIPQVLAWVSELKLWASLEIRQHIAATDGVCVALLVHARPKREINGSLLIAEPLSRRPVLRTRRPNHV
jgi:hypothetical protein